MKILTQALRHGSLPVTFPPEDGQEDPMQSLNMLSQLQACEETAHRAGLQKPILATAEKCCLRFKPAYLLAFRPNRTTVLILNSPYSPELNDGNWHGTQETERERGGYQVQSQPG